MRVDRKALLQTKEKRVTQENLLDVTFNKTLPNIKNVIYKHWHILSIQFFDKNCSFGIEKLRICTK